MASVTSNLGEIQALLDNLSNCIDFTRDGLGADCLDEVAGGIVERNAAETGPTGAWDANRGGYGERKRTAGLPVGVGFRRQGEPGGGGGGSGAMLSQDQIRGEREIKPGQASMIYGNDEYNRRKMQWFANGSTPGPDGGEPSGAKDQPPRPVYDMNDNDVGRIMDVIGQHVEKFIKTQ